MQPEEGERIKATLKDSSDETQNVVLYVDVFVND
jgi:hypothetical protein